MGGAYRLAVRAAFERLGSSSGLDCDRFSCDSFPFKWHYHPEYELTFIVHGAGTRFVGDNISRFTAGDLVFLGPNVPHTWASDVVGAEGCEAIVVHFAEGFLGEGIVGREEAGPVRELLARSRRGLAFEGFRSPAQLEKLIATSGLERLLVLLQILVDMTVVELRPLCSPAFARPHENATRRIDNVCRFLYENCGTGISLTDAAEIAHMTPGSFSRFFRRAMGRSFTSYMNELRVARACALLCDTEFPVGWIATEAGFANLANFNRRFKEIKGLTPSAYRNQFASKAEAALQV